MTKTIENAHYSRLIADLGILIEQGRKAAVRSINTALVSTYWLIGRRVVEFEQKGKERAEYGEELLIRLAQDLSRHFGKGFSKSNLFMMRSFYQLYPESKILQTPPGKSALEKMNADVQKFQTPSGIFGVLYQKFPLSWSHYCLIMRLDEPYKREFYESECIRGNWSVRQLDRQIQSMLYERTALSKRKLAVISKAHEKPFIIKPEDEIKNPYILEFLGMMLERQTFQNKDLVLKVSQNYNPKKYDSNKAKLRYAKEHFAKVNDSQKIQKFYFKFLSPESYDFFFKALREKNYKSFKSEIEAKLER
jgi:hypothetical protein